MKGLELYEKRFTHDVEHSVVKMDEASRRFKMEEMAFQLHHTTRQC